MNKYFLIDTGFWIALFYKDKDFAIDYLITFDKRAKFDFYCNKRRIPLINEYTYNDLL